MPAVLVRGGGVMRITAFTDCDSESIVVRMPYEMIVEVLWLLPNSPDRDELLQKVRIAARRSNKLTKMLSKVHS